MESRDAMDRVAAWISALACAVLCALIPASVGLRGPLGAAVAGRTDGVRLRVTVRDEHGVPIRGAAVRAYHGIEERYSEVAAGRTDSRGAFEALGAPPGEAWVLVEAEGRARSASAVLVGSGEPIDVVLAPAVKLDVAVRDDSGAPIPGATVVVTASDPLPFGALTGPTGAASFGALPGGPWKVRVFARGFDPESRTDVTTDITVVLRRSGGLEVHAVDEAGKPVPGATVLVAGPSLWPSRSTIAGADGVARLTGLSEGAYDLKATKDALVSTTEVGVSVARGEMKPVSLVLAPGRMVPFIVTDGEGDHPLIVANADVVVAEGGVSSFPIQGRTNTFGKVILGPIARGLVVASASAEGFVSRSTVDVPEVITTDVRIPLLRGAFVEGEVVDQEGRPVEGATVEIVGTDVDGSPVSATPETARFQRMHFAWALSGPSPLLPGGELGIMPGPIPAIPGADTPPFAPLEVTEAPGERLDPWVTRLDGTFRAGPVPPGRLAALVRHPSYVESTSQMVTVASGATAHVRIVLLTGGALEATVVDEHDLPVTGARVDVAAIRGSLTRGDFTGDDGRATFPALPADVFVTISRPLDVTRPVLRRRLAIPNGGHTEEKFVLPAPLPKVEVEAEDDSGRPIPVAQVTLLSLDPERPLRETQFTDDAGRATFDDAAGLDVKVIVVRSEYAQWEKEFPKIPERVKAELVPSVIVEGRVTAVRGRRDVPMATVEILASGHRETAFTDPQGRYRFASLTPGPAHLTVSHADYASTELDIKIAATGRADRSFEVDPIDLDDPSVVEGHVFDSEGNGIAGARVAMGAVGAALPATTAAPSAISAADGSFRLERVRAGSVELQAVLTGTGRGRARVTVPAGGHVDGVVIELRPGDEESEPGATGDVAISLAERRSGSRSVVLIEDVARQSEAERAGLLAGDVVASIDQGAPISATDARRRLSGPEGSDVVIEVLREGVRVSARIRRERVRR